MEMIRKPGPRKQEMLNRFFWLRTFLINPGRELGLKPKLKTRLIETVWNAQTAYLQADDDDYNFNVAVETYQMLENVLLTAGIDAEAGIKDIMARNDYTSFNQMKPLSREKLLKAIHVFDEPTPVGITVDPWDL